MGTVRALTTLTVSRDMIPVQVSEDYAFDTPVASMADTKSGLCRKRLVDTNNSGLVVGDKE